MLKAHKTLLQLQKHFYRFMVIVFLIPHLVSCESGTRVFIKETLSLIFVGYRVIWIRTISKDFNNNLWENFISLSAANTGGVLPYISYIADDVLPHRVGFLRRFGLKTGIHFAHFGLESGMVFEGTTGVYEGIYRFNSKWVRMKEKCANSKWIWWVCLFAL